MGLSSAFSSSGPPKPIFPKKSIWRMVIPLVLVANLGIGAYVMISQSQKKKSVEESDAAQEVPAAPVSTAAVVTPDKTPFILAVQPVLEPVKVLPSIREDESGSFLSGSWMRRDR